MQPVPVLQWLGVTVAVEAIAFLIWRIRSSMVTKTEELWRHGDALARRVVDITGGGLPKSTNNFLPSLVALFFFSKSYKTYQAARMLTDRGFVRL